MLNIDFLITVFSLADLPVRRTHGLGLRVGIHEGLSCQRLTGTFAGIGAYLLITTSAKYAHSPLPITEGGGCGFWTAFRLCRVWPRDELPGAVARGCHPRRVCLLCLCNPVMLCG